MDPQRKLQIVCKLEPIVGKLQREGDLGEKKPVLMAGLRVRVQADQDGE